MKDLGYDEKGDLRRGHDDEEEAVRTLNQDSRAIIEEELKEEDTNETKRTRGSSDVEDSLYV